jgi:hypothetical protein
MFFTKVLGFGGTLQNYRSFLEYCGRLRFFLLAMVWPIFLSFAFQVAAKCCRPSGSGDESALDNNTSEGNSNKTDGQFGDESDAVFYENMLHISDTIRNVCVLVFVGREVVSMIY